VIGLAARALVAAVCLLLLAICLQVLAATASGIAADLGLMDPPASARTPARQALPSRLAQTDIPWRARAVYVLAARHYGCRNVTWPVLAAVGKVESDHGRSRLPGVRSGWNRAGAAGPMQFGVGKGRAGNAWATYGQDYDRNGRVNVYSLADAAPAAARYLCEAGAARDPGRALFAYNHSWSYVARVKRTAARYAAGRG
jgi:hypothetical protein